MKFLSVFALIVFIAGVLFFGYIFIVQKSMRPTGNQDDLLDDPQVSAQRQSEKAEETWEKQRRLMEDQKQRMRDLQRR